MEVASLLISRGAAVNGLPDRSCAPFVIDPCLRDMPPLLVAVRARHRRMVLLLVAAGAYVNPPDDAIDYAGHSALNQVLLLFRPAS